MYVGGGVAAMQAAHERRKARKRPGEARKVLMVGNVLRPHSRYFFAPARPQEISLPLSRRGRPTRATMSRSATAKPSYREVDSDGDDGAEKEPWEAMGEQWNMRKEKPPAKQAQSKAATKRGSSHFSASSDAVTTTKKKTASQPPTSQKIGNFFSKPVAGGKSGIKRPAESDDDVEDSDDSEDEFNFKIEGSAKDGKGKGKAKAEAKAKQQKSGGKQKSVGGCLPRPSRPAAPRELRVGSWLPSRCPVSVSVLAPTRALLRSADAGHGRQEGEGVGGRR